MISSEQKQQLLQVIGEYGYSSKVLLWLKKKGIVNPSNNEEYSDGAIRMVMSGKRQNQDIELAIYELRNDIIEKEKKLQEMRAAATKV